MGIRPDVPKEAISIAVLNAAGKLVMESIIKTNSGFSGVVVQIGS